MKSSLIRNLTIASLLIPTLLVKANPPAQGLFTPDVTILPDNENHSALFLTGETDYTTPAFSLEYIRESNNSLGLFRIYDQERNNPWSIYWQWEAAFNGNEMVPMKLNAAGDLYLSGESGSFVFLPGYGEMNLNFAINEEDSTFVTIDMRNPFMRLVAADSSEIMIDATQGITINGRPVLTQVPSGLTVASNGSVGIGVSSPASKLAVASMLPADNWASGVSFTATDTTSSSSINHVGASFVNSWAPSSNLYDSSFTGIANSVSLYGTAGVNSTTKGTLRGTLSNVNIMGSGAVGSAASFNAKMWLNGSSTVDHNLNFFAQSPDNWGSVGGSIINSYGLFLEEQKRSFVTNGYGVYQQGSDDANYFEGKVGIGTSAPAQQLHIKGAGDVGLRLGTSNTENKYVTLDFFESDGTGSGPAGLRMRYEAENNQLNFLNYTAPTAPPIATFQRTGNVGIGTAAPSAKLHVNGDARFTGPVYLAPQGDLDMGDFHHDPTAL